MNRYEQTPQGGTSQGNVSLTWNKIPGLVGFSFIYFLLRIFTLNIYYFWGKTETRRKLWNAVHLQGQPFQYTGTGKELFLGFLVVLFLFFVPIFLVIGALGVLFGPQGQAPVIAGLYIVLLYFIGVAVYRARHYQLTRTTWRGIRGAMHGSSWSFGWTYLWTTFLSVISLGWAIPWQANKLQKMLTEDTRFGDMPMSYDGRSGSLYASFAILWIGIFLIIGLLYGAIFYVGLLMGSGAIQPFPENATPQQIQAIILPYTIAAYVIFFLLVMAISSWYVAKTMNHFAASTTFDNARFNMRATAGSILWLNISNALLVFFTLGIAIPIVQARTLKYRIERMTIDGSIDFNKVAQSQARLGATGEGLAEAFDLGAF